MAILFLTTSSNEQSEWFDMKFPELLAAVKREARIEVGTDLDSLVLDLVNERQEFYARMNRYPSLHVVGHTLNFASDADTLIAIPDDIKIMHLDRDSGRIITESGHVWHILHSKSPLLSVEGFPIYFTHNGSNFIFSPASLTKTSDTFSFDFWRSPVPVPDTAADVDIEPSEAAQVIKLDVINRIQRYHGDTAGADRTSQDASTTFRSVRASQ